jgi:hypothetical protein
MRKKLDGNPWVQLIVLRREDLPEPIKQINETFSTAFQEHAPSKRGREFL